jgi:hypothetical protein
VVPLPQTDRADAFVAAMSLDAPVLVGSINGDPRIWRCG